MYASIILSTRINLKLQRTLKELTPVFAGKMPFKGTKLKVLIFSADLCGVNTAASIDLSVLS